jgi:hypothetical protein
MPAAGLAWASSSSLGPRAPAAARLLVNPTQSLVVPAQARPGRRPSRASVSPHTMGSACGCIPLSEDK